MDELDAPLSSCGIAAPEAARIAEEIGVETVRDLLWHLPRRYATRAEPSAVSELEVGQDVTIVARVQSSSQPRQSRQNLATWRVVVGDGREGVSLTFFARRVGQFIPRQQVLRPGTLVLVSGRATVFNGSWQLAHPDYKVLETEDEDAEGAAAQPIPLYPATGKLPQWKIEKVVATVLSTLGDLPETLPAETVATAGLLAPRAMWEALHQPRSPEHLEAGLQRLRFEEAFVLQVALAQRRVAAAQVPAEPRPRVNAGIAVAFDERLPFTLTGAQRAVGDEIAADLERGYPMQRLLQGDVGSGKTLVALRAMLQVVDAGGQAALLAPTEVLAAQHLRSVTSMLGELGAGGMLGGDTRGTRVVLLTGSQSTAARREALLAAAGGEAGIVIGTHALLEEHVQFADLGLVVVDEQHRFGVEQRDRLRAKGSRVPHLLVMTATPIPRTVAMTVFGDLETSVLDELPPGRADVATHVVPVAEKPAWLDRTWRLVAEQAALGHQSFVVCPRIDADDPTGEGATLLDEVDGSDVDPGTGEAPEMPDDAAAARRRPPLAVADLTRMLGEHPATAGLRTGVLHGRLPAAEKDDVMGRFAAGELDVLVATTVVEVGVDVPRATVMVIADADRFGLSQLHQLRGRIGRGTLPGSCLLLTEAGAGSPAGRRLSAMEKTRDGFELARLDLLQRREGDVLGAAQSGRRSSLKALRVLEDGDVIATARRAAGELVAADPDLTDHPVLAAAVAARVQGGTEAFLERA
ncbi:ATP-dependent DNA helicase RecG [Kineococcus gynurae]|uniref:Probable DNA 3'-5' helicase RecG n=1 Tax=Kineococcus gynurae TaxID=452979 RepID=A0ABV5LVT3_9ACTN